MDFHNILLFLIGGTVVTMTNYLIKKFDSKIGAVFWSLPYSLFPIIIYKWYKNHSNGEIAQMGKNSCMYSLVMFSFLLAFYLTLDKMKENQNGVLYAFMAAFMMWGVISLIFYYFI